jgi:hypothetical protein
MKVVNTNPRDKASNSNKYTLIGMTSIDSRCPDISTTNGAAMENVTAAYSIRGLDLLLIIKGYTLSMENEDHAISFQLTENGFRRVSQTHCIADLKKVAEICMCFGNPRVNLRQPILTDVLTKLEFITISYTL